MKGGDLLIECLKAQNVRCVFGMPGTQNIQIYDSLLRCGAGVKTRADVEKAMELGAAGILLASGVVKAEDPGAVLTELVRGLS